VLFLLRPMTLDYEPRCLNYGGAIEWGHRSGASISIQAHHHQLIGPFRRHGERWSRARGDLTSVYEAPQKCVFEDSRAHVHRRLGEKGKCASIKCGSANHFTLLRPLLSVTSHLSQISFGPGTWSLLVRAKQDWVALPHMVRVCLWRVVYVLFGRGDVQVSDGSLVR